MFIRDSPRREVREECICLALCQSFHVAPSHLSNRTQTCRVAEHQMWNQVRTPRWRTSGCTMTGLPKHEKEWRSSKTAGHKAERSQGCSWRVCKAVAKIYQSANQFAKAQGSKAIALRCLTLNSKFRMILINIIVRWNGQNAKTHGRF